jgi:aminoglycoside N3'-acetyltransferase
MTDYFSDIQHHLDKLGVTDGMHLLVHSSLSDIGKGAARPVELIQSLIDRVGESGCLLMPTFQNDESIEHYVAKNPLYDPRTTPSMTGALTRIFMEQHPVRRSYHPWLAVAALGESMLEHVKDHHLCVKPFDVHSPYYKIMDHPRGYFLFLGTSFRHGSPVHVIESLRWPDYPVKIFQKKSVTMRYLDYEGIEHHMETLIPHRPGHPQWRRFGDELEQMYPNVLRTLHSPLGYRVTLFKGQDFLRIMGEALDKGIYPYNRNYMPRDPITKPLAQFVKKRLGIQGRILPHKG